MFLKIEDYILQHVKATYLQAYVYLDFFFESRICQERSEKKTKGYASLTKNLEKKNCLKKKKLSNTTRVRTQKTNYLKNAYIISREKSNLLIVNIFKMGVTKKSSYQ